MNNKVVQGSKQDIAILMADARFEQHCLKLDKYINEGLKAMFENERISSQRRDRMCKKFQNTVLGVK